MYINSELENAYLLKVCVSITTKCDWQMRYLCSGSLSTFRCAIVSILTIEGTTDYRRGVVVFSVCILSFYKKEPAQRSEGGRNPNPEAVDRECDISFT